MLAQTIVITSIITVSIAPNIIEEPLAGEELEVGLLSVEAASVTTVMVVSLDLFGF
jgi:hypothetical protein